MILSLIGGFLDAYSYLLKGGVFANAQTGNLVLMAIAVTKWDLLGSVKFLIPIVTFSVGILSSNLFTTCRNISHVDKLRLALVLEGFLLLVIGLCGNSISNFVVNCAISFIAAVQVSMFDKFDGNAMATTMITGNLKSGMAILSRFIILKNKVDGEGFGKYLQVIVGFAFGVSIGCLLIGTFHEYSIIACIVPIAIVFWRINKVTLT